jgi:hypothetical protein
VFTPESSSSSSSESESSFFSSDVSCGDGGCSIADFLVFWPPIELGGDFEGDDATAAACGGEGDSASPFRSMSFLPSFSRVNV